MTTTKPAPERDPLDLSAELEDIRLAQAGDGAAATRLFLRYKPLIRATAGKAARARHLDSYAREDLESDMTVALLEALPKFDTSKGAGMAAILPRLFAGIVNQLDTVITIPRTSLNRYWAAMKAADGDTAKAANLATEHGLSRDLFWTIHDGLRVGTSEQAELAAWAGALPPAPTETEAEQVAVALAVLTDRQREVIETMYGFRTAGLHSFDWTAQELGMSKAMVAKHHTAAMERMRAALTPELELIAA